MSDVSGGAAGFTPEKAERLSSAVKKLNSESERLQNNLDRMHELQSTLYQVDSEVLEWILKGNKLKNGKVPLDVVLKNHSPSSTS